MKRLIICIIALIALFTPVAYGQIFQLWQFPQTYAWQMQLSQAVYDQAWANTPRHDMYGVLMAQSMASAEAQRRFDLFIATLCERDLSFCEGLQAQLGIRRTQPFQP